MSNYEDVMKPCTACGRGCLKADAACPHCGHCFAAPVRKRTFHLLPILTAVVAAMLVGYLTFGTIRSVTPPFPETAQSYSLPINPFQQSGLTIAQMQAQTPAKTTLHQVVQKWGNPTSIGRKRDRSHLFYRGKNGLLRLEFAGGSLLRSSYAETLQSRLN